MLPLIESTSIHILPGRPSGALTPKFLSAFSLFILKFIATLCLQVCGVVCWVVDLLVLQLYAWIVAMMLCIGACFWGLLHNTGRKRACYHTTLLLNSLLPVGHSMP